MPFLQQSSGDKKALKKHNNQPPKRRRWGRLVAENWRRCFKANGRGLSTRGGHEGGVTSARKRGGDNKLYWKRGWSRLRLDRNAGGGWPFSSFSSSSSSCSFSSFSSIVIRPLEVMKMTTEEELVVAAAAVAAAPEAASQSSPQSRRRRRGQ